MESQTRHPVPSWIRRGKLRWVWGLWEPLIHYRRWAGMAPYSPGNALWTEEWYLRMHSEEMVEKLAELGVNCISTHYFKGFGMKAEAEEMERAARFTELCHSYGIRVLGYHQWASIYYETFMDEAPHVKDWVQRDADGRLLVYGGRDYYRWLGCQQHEEYVAYLREVVQQCLTEAKMDGIEWDGTTYRCYCELCQRRFREYLEAKYADNNVLGLFGIPHFRNVRIPTHDNRRDPLFQELLEFRQDFMTQRLREYNDLIKSINPEAAQVTYDLHPAPREPIESVDILVDENHNFPFLQDGVLTTKFRGLKHGFALGRVVLSTAWLRAPSTRERRDAFAFKNEQELVTFGAPASDLRRPETAAEVQLDLAEAAMYGGHMITPTWATRSIGGNRAAFEDPRLYEPLHRYMDFFRRHEDLYDVRNSLANVAIFRGHSSITFDFFNSYPCVVGMEQICLQHQIPFEMLFSFQLDSLEQYDAIVLAEQTCLSNEEIEAFLGFVNDGGGLVITGRTGLYDDRNRHRSSYPFERLLDNPRVVFFPDTPERLSMPESDHPPRYRDMRLPKRSDEIVAGMMAATGGKLPYKVHADRYVGTDAYLVASGERVIHLLNYDNKKRTGPLAVTVSEALAAERVRLVSPDRDPEECWLEAQNSSGDRFVLDGVDTYSLLVFPAQ